MLPVSSNESKSVLEHIVELRSRLFISLGALVVGMIAAHFYHQDIITFVLQPAGEQRLIFLSPLDPLLFVLKVDFLAGFILAFPIFVWCLISFLQPALSRSLKSALYLVYATSAVLLVAGLAYAYFVTIPISLKFLFSITIPGIENQITAQSYVGFFLTQAVLIAAVFQIPLFLIAGMYLKLFRPETLSTKRSYVYVAGTIALAVLTPTPDIFNLLILLLPAALIFEISILVGRLFLYLK